MPKESSEDKSLVSNCVVCGKKLKHSDCDGISEAIYAGWGVLFFGKKFVLLCSGSCCGKLNDKLIN